MSSYVEEWHAKQRTEEQAEQPQVYGFVQQTPPAKAAVDPQTRAFIEKEKQELLAKVRPASLPATPMNRGQGFSFVQPTPPAKRGFGEVHER